MTDFDPAFEQLVNSAIATKASGRKETISYCRGTFAHAMDLIAEQRFAEANRKLMNLNYYIDCIPRMPEIEGIYDTAWELIRMLDEPVDYCGDYLIEFTLPLHLITPEEE